MRWCLHIFLIPLLNWSDHPSTRKDTPCWLSITTYHPLYVWREREFSKSNTLEIRKCSAKIYRSVSTYDGRDEITIFNLFKSLRSSSCGGKKKIIINLKSSDVVRDCYSSVIKENFLFHFSLMMSKWVDIFLSHHRWRRDCRRAHAKSTKNGPIDTVIFLFSYIPSSPFDKRRRRNRQNGEVDCVNGSPARSSW